MVIVNNYVDMVNAERRFRTPRHSLLLTLNRNCHSTFSSWERDAQVVEHTVKAMRILAVDMR